MTAPKSTEAHSPEPWSADDWTGDQGGKVRGVSASDRSEVLGERNPSIADRRRILACVNACAGIPTAALEAGKLGEALAAATSLFANRHPTDYGHGWEVDLLRRRLQELGVLS